MYAEYLSIISKHYDLGNRKGINEAKKIKLKIRKQIK